MEVKRALLKYPAIRRQQRYGGQSHHSGKNGLESLADC